MREALTVPMTPEMFERMKRLGQQIKRGNVPREIAHVKKRLAEAEANAEALYIMFGGRIDQGSIDEAVFWRMELDGAYMRETLAA